MTGGTLSLHRNDYLHASPLGQNSEKQPQNQKTFLIDGLLSVAPCGAALSEASSCNETLAGFQKSKRRRALDWDAPHIFRGTFSRASVPGLVSTPGVARVLLLPRPPNRS